jgi:hypothetical protein
VKAIKILLSISMALFFGIAVQGATGLNAYAVAGTVLAFNAVLPYVVKDIQHYAFMATSVISPDVSLISDYAGDHKGELFRKMVFGMEAARHLTIQPDIKDETPLINLKVTKGLRPYNNRVQSESQIQYAQRKLKTGLGKKELEVDPQSYRGTYLSKYMDPSAFSRKIPFEQFTNEAILEEFGTEINESVVYYGLHPDRFATFDAGAVYAVGALIKFANSGIFDYYRVVTLTEAGQSPTTHAAKFLKITDRAISDGFQIHLLEDIAASRLAQTVVGEIDNATRKAVASFLKVFRALPTPYRTKTNYAYCSFDTFDLLIDDMREIEQYTVTDSSTNMIQESAIYVPGTNRKLIAQACGWLGASERIIVTQRENMIFGCDLLSDANQIRTIDEMWTTQMGLLFNPGFNYALTEAVAINDRD